MCNGGDAVGTLTRCLAIIVAILLGGACEPGDDDGTSPPPVESSVTSEPNSGESGATTSLPVPPSESVAVTVSQSGVTGWWDGRSWVAADGKRPVPVSGGEMYSVLRVTGPVVTKRGSAAKERCETDPGTSSIEIPGLAEDGTWPGPIAVSGVPNPRPRATNVLDTAAMVYREAAGKVLAERKIDDPDADVVQALRTDLEGDGKDEVVVVAERIADPGLYARAGDYSFVLLRGLVGEAVVTTVVAESVPDLTPNTTPFIQSHRVVAIADLNGDRRMEIAVANRQYEGAGMSVHELQPNGSIPAVMEVDCGA